MPSTVFSYDRIHRYTLWREWNDIFSRPNGEQIPYVNFICLNPSTADETKNDPTMRKCIKFAGRWGYDAMCVTNIFAYRSTNPNVLPGIADPIGPDNDYWIKQVAAGAGLVIAAWSQHAGLYGRSTQVRALLRDTGKQVHYLKMGIGKNPEPHHPLYLPDSTEPQLWVTM